MQKFTELLVECEQRRLAPTRLAPDDLDVPFLTTAALDRAMRNGGLQRRLGKCVGFFKYTQREFALSTVTDGTIRLCPASQYNSRALNSAIRDDELHLTTYISPYDYDLGLVDPIIRARHPVRTSLEVTYTKPTDFYMYCFSTSFDLRYFFDFECDTCVVIRDQRQFEKRLCGAVTKALPGWRIQTRPVRYIDPFQMNNFSAVPSADVIFYKDFRYLYQREFRLVAVPPPDLAAPLSPVFVNLGSLKDICEIVPLD
jgi:hypothetical protein